MDLALRLEFGDESPTHSEEEEYLIKHHEFEFFLVSDRCLMLWSRPLHAESRHPNVVVAGAHAQECVTCIPNLLESGIVLNNELTPDVDLLFIIIFVVETLISIFRLRSHLGE